MSDLLGSFGFSGNRGHSALEKDKSVRLRPKRTILHGFGSGVTIWWPMLAPTSRLVVRGWTIISSVGECNTRPVFRVLTFYVQCRAWIAGLNSDFVAPMR